MEHFADFSWDQDTGKWRASCSCGWEDEASYNTARPASEAAQEHQAGAHPREPSDVEITGAGSS